MAEADLIEMSSEGADSELQGKVQRLIYDIWQKTYIELNIISISEAIGGLPV